MKRPQVSVSVDSDVFVLLRELAEADKRSLSQVAEQSIYKGIGAVEKEIKDAGKLPAKKPRAKSASSNLSTIQRSIECDRMAV